MNRRRVGLCLAILALPLFLAVPAQAQQAWIVDILANPSRYWNRTVTLTGQVQNVNANPAGTTRGTYTLLDESCPNPMTVRTSDLPPVGRTYAVTGVIMQDPTAGTTFMKELSRAEPGMSSAMLYSLIAAGLLFLGLLITFIVMLLKPKRAAAMPAPGPVAETIRPRPQDTIRPPARPVAPPPPPAPAPVQDTSKTMKIPAPPVADRTQVFTSLGADLVVEKGPDKGREFTLHLPVTAIGRAGGRRNDVEIADETVSKDQASIFYDSSAKLFSIANESSTNPTKVNGQAISGPTTLDHGAIIEMGRTTVRFRKA